MTLLADVTVGGETPAEQGRSSETEALHRADLQIERLYNVTPTGQWFYTPDGLGLVWFDNSADALEETGAFGAPVIQVDRPPAD